MASELGGGATSGGLDETPAGDIVVLALYHDPAKDVASNFGAALDSKTVVDISNSINMETFDSLVVGPESSGAEEIAKLLPGARVVKAFSTTFAGPLTEGSADGKPLDVFIAADSEEARRQVTDLVGAAGMRPFEVGGLHRARELEGFQLLVMALQANPAYDTFNWGTALKIID